MRLIVEKSALEGMLARAASVVPGKTTIPILSHVQIMALGQVLSLQATDLDILFAGSAPAEVERAGSICVSASRLRDIVARQVAGRPIVLDAVDGAVTIICGRSRSVLPVLSADDFPSIDMGERPWRWSMEAGSLRRLIGTPAPFASTDESRPYLHGVHLTVRSDQIDAATTDGHRLALISHPLPDGLAKFPGVIVPSRTVLLALKIAAKLSGEIEVALSDRSISFDFAGAGLNERLVSKLIDGTFPDYMRVIPASTGKGVRVGRETLEETLARVRAVTVDRGGAVKLATEGGALLLKARGGGEAGGEAEDELDADAMGGGMKAAFNGAYLAEVLGALEGAKCTLDAGGPSCPMRVTGDGDSHVVFVIMPMRW